MLAGFKHDCVTHQKRRDDFLDDLSKRIVPGCDAGDDADGLANDGALFELFFENDLLAFANVGLDADELIVAVCVGRIADGRSQFQSFKPNDFVAICLEDFQGLLHQLNAFGKRRGRPSGER